MSGGRVVLVRVCGRCLAVGFGLGWNLVGALCGFCREWIDGEWGCCDGSECDVYVGGGCWTCMGLCVRMVSNSKVLCGSSCCVPNDVWSGGFWGGER